MILAANSIRNKKEALLLFLKTFTGILLRVFPACLCFAKGWKRFVRGWMEGSAAIWH